MRLQPSGFSCEYCEIHKDSYFIESEYIRSTAFCWTPVFYSKVVLKIDTKPHDLTRIGIPFLLKLQVSLLKLCLKSRRNQHEDFLKIFVMFLEIFQGHVKGFFKSSARIFSMKKELLEIPRNSHENACVGFSFLKSCRSRGCN